MNSAVLPSANRDAHPENDTMRPTTWALSATILAAGAIGWLSGANYRAEVRAQEKSPGPAAETVKTRVGELKYESGYPTDETVQKLYDEMDFQRACQAYLWAIPAVGMNEWRKAHFDIFQAKNGEMLSYLDFAEKLGILTPNYTTPYICWFVDLEKSGPFVIEIPPGLMAGMILDTWQRVLADLGVVGPDAGKGGKFLILPPGHEKVEAPGYFTVQSPGRILFACVRLLDADKEKAIRELIPGIKTYTWLPSGTGQRSSRP